MAKTTERLALTQPPDFYRAVAADVYRTTEVLSVDLLHCKFGRDALFAAAEAAGSAAHSHQLRMDQARRGRQLAKAVRHLSAAADALEEVGNLALLRYFPDLREKTDEIAKDIPRRFSHSGSGSPGRPIQLAAVRAIAQIWSERQGRPIPKRRPQPGGLLHALIVAVSQDLFGHPAVLSPSAVASAVNDEESTVDA